jgi:hypothetical protein
MALMENHYNPATKTMAIPPVLQKYAPLLGDTFPLPSL